mgnify:CR=1 FL=1
MSVQRVDWSKLDDIVDIVSGEFDYEKLTLFSIFKNELFFCQSFFDHYRRLGVEQFLILDDGSTDGTKQFLEAQDDCVVLSSKLGFEDPVEYHPRPGVRTATRAAIFLKAAVPQFFLPNMYSLYVDADEFLILPPGVANLSELVRDLRSRNLGAVASSLIDFYPIFISSVSEHAPETSAEIFAMCPYFDCRKLLRISFNGKPVAKYPSKLRALAVQHGMRVESRLRKRIRQRVRGRALANPMSYKTPLVLHTPERYYVSSHRVCGRVARDKILSTAHFVFTPNSWRKAEKIVTGGERRGMKYEALLGILRGNEIGAVPFVCARSRRFESAQQLIDCGLMRWDAR